MALKKLEKANLSKEDSQSIFRGQVKLSKSYFQSRLKFHIKQMSAKHGLELESTL